MGYLTGLPPYVGGPPSPYPPLYTSYFGVLRGGTIARCKFLEKKFRKMGLLGLGKNLVNRNRTLNRKKNFWKIFGEFTTLHFLLLIGCFLSL
jgi:hypothetical protein